MRSLLKKAFSEKKKKGFVWIEAVLYIALGVVAISLVMTAGLPLINKMKDRNTIIQTKDLMHTIDESIWQVRSDGIGSRRFLEPIIIKGGKLMIFGDEYNGEEKNSIVWEIKTKAGMMEACPADEEPEESCTQSEGNLKMVAIQTLVEGEDTIKLILDYSENIKLEVEDYTSGSALTGKYALSIENSGESKITLKVI